MKTTRIVWSIAGSDPSGGAGIQADLKVFQGLGLYGCAALTSVIAQNTVGVRSVRPVSAEFLKEQLEVLAKDVPPHSVKIGLVPTCEAARAIAESLKPLNVPVVYDPVAVSGSGHALAVEDVLSAIRAHLLPITAVLTPNALEAEALTDVPIRTHDDMLKAARRLCAMGARAVLLKGGHTSAPSACDLWFDGTCAVWLHSPRVVNRTFHGTGCTLSSALAAGLAQGLQPLDAAVLAKTYVNRGLRCAPVIGAGRRPLYHGAWPDSPRDLPLLTDDPDESAPAPAFPDCGPQPLGFYLIVNRAADIDRLAPTGARTFQLRAKDLRDSALDHEVALAVALARRFSVRLFINDAADLALKHRAYGVHLGQKDWSPAQIEALRRAGLRLGVSAYTWSDLARACALQPSYVGIGTVFATESKDVATPPLGIDGLRRLTQVSPVPVVAIGGITLERSREVFATGVNGIAVISDVHKAPDPLQRARNWQTAWDALWHARQTLYPPDNLHQHFQ